MYGAGRSMEDMLDSGRGLPILIQVTLSSSFEVVPALVKPKFHHRVECIVVLKKTYNKKHHSQAFNSTCKVTSWLNVSLKYSILLIKAWSLLVGC